MKKLSVILTLILTLISCGKDNSSGGDDSNNVTINGLGATERYTLMASTLEEKSVMYDNFGVFGLELLKDRSFYLMKQTRRGGLRDIVTGTWSISGTHIVLPRVGTGSYMESNENGVLYDCLYFHSESLSPEVKDYLRMANLSENSVLKFCKRR